MIYHIIRAKATETARPDYFAVETPNGVKRHVENLTRGGWLHIEPRTITKRDKRIEGVLKRCKIGSERERANLQAYYNAQN